MGVAIRRGVAVLGVAIRRSLRLKALRLGGACGLKRCDKTGLCYIESLTIKAAPYCIGSLTIKAEPSPTLLSTAILPLQSCTMRLQMESPKPRPRLVCDLSVW